VSQVKRVARGSELDDPLDPSFFFSSRLNRGPSESVPRLPVCDLFWWSYEPSINDDFLKFLLLPLLGLGP